MDKVKLRYEGTNVDTIYLADLNDLCEYPSIEHGQFLELDLTESVKHSICSGIIKYFSNVHSNSCFDNGAPLLVIYNDVSLEDVCTYHSLSSMIRFGDVNFAILCTGFVSNDIMIKMSSMIRDYYTGVLNGKY
jgi:hypothetical protein